MVRPPGSGTSSASPVWWSISTGPVTGPGTSSGGSATWSAGPGPVVHAPPGGRSRRRVVTWTSPSRSTDPISWRWPATVGGTPAEVIDLLTAADLQVAFVGFSPGFPYLVGLPPELAAVPRLETPRVSVPAGSVAVGGGFASVYPRPRPAGGACSAVPPWRCSTRTIRPTRLLRTGDTVRFSAEGPGAAGGRRDGRSGGGRSGGGRSGGRGPSSATPGGRVPGPSGPRPPMPARSGRFVEVLDPGLLSLVEDGGRREVAALGIPRAGPADPDAMRLANRLVGNPDGAAAIEATTVGPTLRFTGSAHVAVVAPSPEGQQVLIDGHPTGPGAVSPVEDGQVVTVGRVLGGLRAYVAVSGGFETPPVVGSRSTDLLSGLGPGPLIAGDHLDIGPPNRPRGRLLHPLDPKARIRPVVVRVIVGPHRLPPESHGLLTSGLWTVGPASNRIGVRLTAGSRRATAPGHPIPSTGMVTGAVQLPPDGDPIILLPDHATVGGYPVIACVIAADLPVVGQLEPGDTVELVAVDRADCTPRAGQAGPGAHRAGHRLVPDRGGYVATNSRVPGGQTAGTEGPKRFRAPAPPLGCRTPLPSCAWP